MFISGQFSKAPNYEDKSFGGMVYGVDNSHYNVDIGAEWSPKKNLTLKPHYGYYSYTADPSLDFGNYSAHVAWLECAFDW